MILRRLYIIQDGIYNRILVKLEVCNRKVGPVISALKCLFTAFRLIKNQILLDHHCLVFAFA